MSDAESEPLFDDALASQDELRSLLALPSPSFTVETPSSSDANDETDYEVQNLPNLALRRLSVPTTSDDSTEISQSSMLDPNPSDVNAMGFSTLVNPKSHYKGYVPPLPIYQERVAIQELRQASIRQRSSSPRAAKSPESDDFVEFNLTDFAIYLPRNAHHSYELRGLQDFASKSGHSCMLFDGILCNGSERRYVQGVPFEICSIGNYGIENHTVGNDIWIQTTFNKRSDVYYRLKVPASEYERFHRDFLWLADLAKHFVDYLEECEKKHTAVSIHNFRADFSQWARNAHKGSAEFHSWYAKYRDHDFRMAISFNINFLFKESIGVKDRLRKQPIWSEILEKDRIPLQAVEQVQTIVTPYVYECFEHFKFGNHLKSVAPTRAAHERQTSQGNALHLTVDVAPSRLVVEIPALSTVKLGNGSSKSVSRVAVKIPAFRDPSIEHARKIRSIKPGDVLSVTKDGKGSVWRDEVSLWKAADDCWYVYVQGVHQSDKGVRSFDAIWLYKPSDTSCAKMKYPFPKELFLSNNCTCKESRIPEDEVIDIVSVNWQGQPSESYQKLFVRQTYLDNEKFVTLKDTHKICEHRHDKKESSSAKSAHKYGIGQTVLVSETALVPPRRKSKYGLDPFEIVKYETLHSKEYAILRRLPRRNEIDKQGSFQANELVYSDETAKVVSTKIERRCLVRFYTNVDVSSNTIPAPYSRNGTGNTFYITTRLSGTDGNKRLTPMQGIITPSLIQGFDPSQAPSRPKLRGLDLYCGGGNFGRGLEEGGAMHNEWAVDMDKVAVHNYFANLRDPQDTKLYHGSVNDQLYQAMQGNVKNSKLVPRPGDVDFISAGSPCQGFSKLNMKATQEKGLKNQSLVASVAAYVDFYRPKYGLLENVLNMAQKRKGRDEDVLSQLICAIVGMGYQLSTFMVDAWSCGSAQSRSRIFVAFTAPGYEPIPHPELSHSHPNHITDRGLGELANGMAFGERKWGPTPFNFVTASEAIGDLLYIGDGRTYSCIPFPDHVMPTAMMKEMKLQIQAIPKFPRNMTFWKAWNDGKGVMSKEQRALFPNSTSNSGKPREGVQKGSKAWGRLDPDGLFATVVVAPAVRDSRMGRQLHWDQQRPLTNMESRRAQCFPDNEVIIGTPAQQAKIIGNSVDRTVSLALGLSLREAWEKNPSDDEVRNSAIEEDVPLRSTKVQPIVSRDSHGRYFKNSSNTATVSTTSTSERSSPNNEEDGVASAGKNTAPSIESTPLVRDSHGSFTKKANKAAQEKEKRATSKQKPSTIPSNRVIRDSCESSSDEGFSEHDSHSALALRSSQSPGQSRAVESISKPPSTSKLETQPGSLKRPHVVIETRIMPPEKSYKAAKLSAAASPASSKIADPKLTTSTAKEANLLQSSRSQPVNATHLSQKLQVVLTQGVAHKTDSVAADNNDESDELDETDFSGFSTSEDEESDANQENKPIPKPIPQPTSPSHHRVISTSNRGKGKSPTKARPLNQFYIDLTSADDTTKSQPQLRPKWGSQIQKSKRHPTKLHVRSGPHTSPIPPQGQPQRRPSAKLSVRPGPHTPPMPMPVPKKYVPVDNRKFAAYLQTYVLKGYNQARKQR